MRRLIILFAIVFFSSSAAVADMSAVKIFYPKSYAEILAANEDKEFTLIFWSVSCTPCLKELKLISETKMYTNQKFVFVSIDGDIMSDDVIAVINKMDLQQQEHWVFKSELTQEIINTVDENWYGEVPRNYFFDEDQERTRLKVFK